MTIRVGVDVGGTFTKADRLRHRRGAVVADAIVPTTHDHADGVAAGVVDVVAQLAVARRPRAHRPRHPLDDPSRERAARRATSPRVGMIGMGRAPDLRKARKRTIGPRIELSEGRTLETDVGVPRRHQRAQRRAAARGRARDCTRRARRRSRWPRRSRPTTSPTKRMISAAAEQTRPSGHHVGRAHRAVRARAAGGHRRAQRVDPADRAAHRRGRRRRASPRPASRARSWSCAATAARPTSPGFRRAPARTLYSGPAASVAGALRSSRIDDAVIVEVGGTSTNVAAIRRGPPGAVVRAGREPRRPRSARSTCG